MSVPKEFAAFVTEPQWEKLALAGLDTSDREIVLRVLRDALKGADPEVEDPEDIAEVVALAQEIADDFREKFDDEGYDENEVTAGGQTSGELLEEVNGE